MLAKIDKYKMLEMLLNACPNIEKDWKEHQEWWGNEVAGHYNDISVIAHHVINEYKDMNTSFFPRFFCVIEQLLIEGTEETKQLITIGLIEDIQNISSHDIGWKVFEKYLGPETIKAWNYIINLWINKNSLMDVIRSENNKI